MHHPAFWGAWLLLSVLLVHPDSRVAAAPVARFDSLFHQSYPVRAVFFARRVLPALHQVPLARALGLLDSLERTGEALQDPGAVLEVRIGKLDFRESEGLSTADEKIAGLEHLLQDEYTGSTPQYRAVLLANLGNIQFGVKHNYARAFEYLIKAHTLANTFSSTEFPDKKAVCNWLGNRYYTLGDHQRAEAILLAADTIRHARDSTSSYNCKNTLGLIYRSRKEYPRAEQYFYTVKHQAERDGNRVWAAIATGNIGITWYLLGRYADAVPLLWTDVRESFRPGTFPMDNGMNSLLILADIHLRTDSFAALEADVRLARRYLDSCRDHVRPLSMLYPILAKYSYARADFRQAYQYQDSAWRYSDSIRQRDHIYKLAQVEHRHELAAAALDLHRANNEKRMLTTTRNVLMACVALAVLAAGLLINRQKLRHRLQQDSLLAGKRRVEEDLQQATDQLERYTRHLHEKNAIIETAMQNIEQLTATLTAEQSEQHQNDVLLQLYQSTILTDDQWNEFKLLFEKVHQGYLHRLRTKLPDLTPADTRFLVLSRLHLPNKEMASILGVQPDTIRSYKHRLKKRFGLPDDTDMRNFVDAI